MEDFIGRSTTKGPAHIRDDEGRLTVAVLYGAYHINDLAARFVNDLGLVASTTITDAIAASGVATQISMHDAQDNLTCWRIQTPTLGRALSSTSLDNEDEIAVVDNGNPRTLAVLAAGVGMYLFVGAMDWLLLCDVLAKALQVFVEGYLSLLPAAAVAAQSPPTLAPLPPLDTTVLLAGFYLIFYVQRHLYMLRQIGLVGIQWDRGLFMDM